MTRSIMVVAGARPNFMKVAPILRALDAAGIATELVHTGQHYDAVMSDVFFQQLGIRAPDVHLQIGSGTHGVQTGRIMCAFEDWLLGRAYPPRGVVVVGDVNSTMAAALVASKLHIPVAHVEAGLRSGDREMPEEINRLVTDAVCDVLFVSEPSGSANLQREGIPAERVHYVGNVMIDTLVHQLPAARELASRAPRVATPYALVTLHRPSNVDDSGRLAALSEFLRRIATRIPLVFPLHPRTRARLEGLGLLGEIERHPQINLCTPQAYREFIGLLDGAAVVISDSGGIQEEATFLGIPCVTLRSTTERPVTITHGTNTLAGEDLVAAEAHIAAVVGAERRPTPPIAGWDGAAAIRIVDVLARVWA